MHVRCVLTAVSCRWVCWIGPNWSRGGQIFRTLLWSCGPATCALATCGTRLFCGQLRMQLARQHVACSAHPPNRSGTNSSDGKLRNPVQPRRHVSRAEHTVDVCLGGIAPQLMSGLGTSPSILPSASPSSMEGAAGRGADGVTGSPCFSPPFPRELPPPGVPNASCNAALCSATSGSALRASSSSFSKSSSNSAKWRAARSTSSLLKRVMA
mmetsp:Transcript_66721/g.132211  ORF Transcript_66721/g.132211 Transcript_66721/m.132211 type:complete len:211 (-) Transcript_66721:732-1364(-)